MTKQKTCKYPSDHLPKDAQPGGHPGPTISQLLPPQPGNDWLLLDEEASAEVFSGRILPGPCPLHGWPGALWLEAWLVAAEREPGSPWLGTPTPGHLLRGGVSL